MAYTEITDHVTRALARLKTVFSTSVEFRGVLAALALECQALETAKLSVRESIRNPDNGGTGNLATMVRVAKLIGARPLGTLAAADYVNLINAQIQVNKGQGSPEDLINVYNAMLKPYTGDLIEILDAGETGSQGYTSGPGVLQLISQLDMGKFATFEQARNAMALIKSATPVGSRTIVTMAIDPVLNTGAIFFCDASNTDDSGYGLLASFDSPLVR
jgi:hypothetical protein